MLKGSIIFLMYSYLSLSCDDECFRTSVSDINIYIYIYTSDQITFVVLNATDKHV